MFVAHIVDVWWVITPSFYPQGIHVSWLDFAALLGIGGVWLFVFARNLLSKPLDSNQRSTLRSRDQDMNPQGHQTGNATHEKRDVDVLNLLSSRPYFFWSSESVCLSVGEFSIFSIGSVRREKGRECKWPDGSQVSAAAAS
jgi:hypothetical protein